MFSLSELLTSPRWHRVRFGLGLGLILVGGFIARRAFNEWGHDLAQIYTAALLLLEGKNVYDWGVQHDGYMRFIGWIPTWGHFYPPASSVFAVPVTVIPYPLLKQVWFFGSIALLFYGLWRFMAAYLPRWDYSLRTLALGVVMCCACIRWGFKVAQPGAIVLGMLGLFLAELKERGRSWLLALQAGLVLSIKFTFSLPFLILLVAQRRLLAASAAVAAWGAMNIIGIYGHGGLGILADYRANMAVFERPDQLNYPDPRGGNSLARTDWPYLLNAFKPDFHVNSLIGHGLTALTALWLAWEILRVRPAALREDKSVLALAAPGAALTLLAVYHHHYDMCILLLPVLGYLGFAEFRALKAAWVYVAAVGLYAGCYPYAQFAAFLQSLVGDVSVLIAKPLATVVCIIALVSSMVVLRATLSPRVSAMPLDRDC